MMNILPIKLIRYILVIGVTIYYFIMFKNKNVFLARLQDLYKYIIYNIHIFKILQYLGVFLLII